MRCRLSWKEHADFYKLLLEYNENPVDNPLGLLTAWKLYENSIYRQLKGHVGIENLYILSAG